MRISRDDPGLRVKELTAELARLNDELQQERDNFKGVLDAMNDAVYIADRHYNVRYINSAMEKEFGPVGERKCYEYLQGRTTVCQGCRKAQVLAGKSMQWECRSDRNGRTYGIFDTPVRGPGGNVSIAGMSIFHDITERKEAADKIQRQLDRLAALRSIDMAITGSLDLRVTLGVFIEQVIAQLGVDAVSVLVERPDAHILEYAASKGFRTEAVKHSHIRMGHGYAGHVARTRKPLAVTDMITDKKLPDRPSFFGDEDFRTYFGTPLIAKGRVIGVLEVFHRRPVKPDRDWADFFEALAAQCAIAIESANLFAELMHSKDELVIAYDSTLEGWSRALDYRDRATEGHSRRVAEITVKIARMMGVSEAEIAHIRRGALLHDIGKLGVPDNILLKAGRLTEEESESMKKHPQIAYDLLYPIEFLRPAIDIPYCHHEKWDGSGYPRGLKGEVIPRSARIFSPIDVWDALRSDRPYRTAWTDENIRDHIRSLAGAEFDPDIVENLLLYMA